MGFYFKPRIDHTDLALHLDALNPRSFTGFNSFVNMSSWVHGSEGSITGFSRNGDTTENVRVLATNPFGQQSIVWECRADSVSGADGGWITPYVTIDNTKTYRFSVWAKRAVQGNGGFYLGTNGTGSVAGVLNRSNAALNTNPYFIVTGDAAVLSDWQLHVGHVWPHGSGTGTVHPDTGRYTRFGGKVSSSVSDFVWLPETTQARHRCYLYYSTDTSTRQHMWDPRFECCDGTEPTIQQLLDNAPYKWYDISGNGNHAVQNGDQSRWAFGNGAHTQINTSVADTTTLDTDCFWWSLDHSASLDRTNFENWTVLGWVSSSDAMASNNGTGWFHKGDARWHIEHKDATIRVPTLTSWQSHTVPVDALVNTYKHIAVTYTASATTSRFYLNGTLHSTHTTNVTNPDNAAAIWLGRRYGHFRHAFNGKLATYKVYRRALSAEEVYNEYLATRSRFI